jgi:large subunit ribosomal protein L15
MINLSSLTNTHRPRKKVQRVGRGPGSKRGKTGCRGVKGDKARRGYQRRFGNEGGQLPLYRKLPVKGFVNGLFRNEVHAINLSLIEQLYKDGETVNLETLREKGYAPREVAGGLKILSSGSLSKKVKIEAQSFSKAAIEKLEAAKISFTVVT